MSENMFPLKGVKVIDFTIYVAAPAATCIFGYLGADVIKVETPKGDPYRGMGAGFGMPATDDENPLYDTVNGYKKGLSLDLRSEDGKAVMRRLIEQADIFVTNYRDKALQGMGLTYEEVKAINPRIVYGAGYAYGPKGPDADLPGYDSTTFFARSGFAQEASYAGAPPALNPSGSGDTVTSMALAVGVMAAYLQAKETGVGSMVSTSLYTSALWALASPIARRHYVPRNNNRIGDYRKPGSMALYGDFRLKDGEWVRFCAPTAERYWPNFCRALGLEEYIDDPRFATTKASSAHGPECYALMAEKLEQKTFAEWAPIFEEYDVPGEKIYGVYEAITHPQALANNYAQPVQYPDRVVNFPAPPIQISTLFDPAPRTVAPKIGEHSREVLTQYGFSADEIETLIAGGAVKAI